MSQLDLRRFNFKYITGETVWIMHDNKPKSVEIWDIFITYTKNGGEKIVKYTVDGGSIAIKEELLFSSKQELIKSL